MRYIDVQVLRVRLMKTSYVNHVTSTLSGLTYVVGVAVRQQQAEEQEPACSPQAKLTMAGRSRHKRSFSYSPRAAINNGRLSFFMKHCMPASQGFFVLPSNLTGLCRG